MIDVVNKENREGLVGSFIPRTYIKDCDEEIGRNNLTLILCRRIQEQSEYFLLRVREYSNKIGLDRHVYLFHSLKAEVGHF